MSEVKTWREVELFKADHGLLTYRFEGNHIRLTAGNGDNILTTIPYANGFCMHPLKCAGRGSCPRSYACSE